MNLLEQQAALPAPQITKHGRCPVSSTKGTRIFESALVVKHA